MDKSAVKSYMDNPVPKTHEEKTAPQRMFAHAYFGLQYFIVRFAVIGFRLSPTLEDWMRALNIERIIDVLRDLIAGFEDIMSAKHPLFFVSSFLPYAIRLAILLIPAALWIYALYTLIIYILAQNDIINHGRHINKDVRVHVLVGQPGSGKSSSAGYDAVVTARRMWDELSWKYLTMREFVPDYIREGDAQKLLEWYEVRDSYNFYESNDCVPCLWSNIPLTTDGQNVNCLTYEHLAQLERLPYYSCLFIDEIGSVLRLSMSASKVLTVSDFCRLERHAGDFVIYGTEQEESNIYIDFRRVAGENRYMLSQRPVNKPLALLWPYKLIRRIMLWTDCGCRPLIKFMLKFKSYIDHIGQRRYVYINKGNELMGGVPELGRRGRARKVVMYLPPQLNYQYDDRNMRNLYLAKDKPLKADIFPSLVIEDTEDNLKRYLKSTDPKSWQEATAPTKYKRADKKGKDSKTRDKKSA